MEQDGFTRMMDDAAAFFCDLAQNNSKDWFAPRKDHYQNAIKKPAELLGDLLAEDFARLSGHPYQPKLFRIYRDVRFSKDKTPLNAHLHLLWRQPEDDQFAPAFFFGAAPNYTTAGFGIMGLKGEALARWRIFVDAHGDDLRAKIANSGMSLSDWGDPPLKRVPAPHAKDHPHADLLKRKSLVISTELGDTWRSHPGGLLAALRDQFKATLPVADLLKTHFAKAKPAEITR